MNTMNPNEIKKTLERCINDDCDNCPNTFGNCERNLMLDALAYINQLEAKVIKEQNKNSRLRNIYNRQKAEIERLNNVNQRYRETVGELCIKDDKVVYIFADQGTEYIRNDLAEALKNMAVSDTIKEFVKKAKESKIYDSVRHEYVVPVAVIDWTEQEMVDEE